MPLPRFGGFLKSLCVVFGNILSLIESPIVSVMPKFTELLRFIEGLGGAEDVILGGHVVSFRHES